MIRLCNDFYMTVFKESDTYQCTCKCGNKTLDSIKCGKFLD